MKKRFNATARYISFAALFVGIMIFYVIMMAKVQIDGPATERTDPDVAYTRTVSVSGLRGEIYDRNGTLIVGNNSSYDLLFEYGSIPDTTPELNASILDALRAIHATGNAHCLSLEYYAFSGEYPELEYCAAIGDKSSEEYRALSRILDANMLDADTDAKTLVEHLTKKYKLDPLIYSQDEIDALLRVRYEMERIRFGTYTPLVLAKNVGLELVSFVEEADIDGVNFKVNSEREYKFPGYASHILGRLGKIQAEDAEYYSELGYPMDAYVGTSGCEQLFEGYLRGQDGKMEISYDASGNVIGKRFITDPISGNDVYLTIDIELQIAAEDALKKNIESLEFATSGATLALDPKDNGILAIASYPTYDLTQFGSQEYYDSLLADPNKPLLDRALLGQYAPGSIYKLGASIAALESGTITPSTLLNCTGVYPGYHHPTCLGVHGDLGVVRAIGVSCNCFFYEIGHRLGIDAISPYTKALGLGSATGIELPERTGSVAGTELREQNGGVWDKGDNLSAAIGQSDHTYTPLQIGVYLSSITARGTRQSAHLLHSVRKFYTKEIVYEYTGAVLETTAISDTTYNTVISGMKAVVNESATLSRLFSSLDVTVAGKTGTAQVTGKKDYSLFAGVANVDNPDIVGVCVIEQGVNSANAATTVSDIFKAFYES